MLSLPCVTSSDVGGLTCSVCILRWRALRPSRGSTRTWSPCATRPLGRTQRLGPRGAPCHASFRSRSGGAPRQRSSASLTPPLRLRSARGMLRQQPPIDVTHWPVDGMAAPHHCHRRALAASLKRLKTTYVDLYQLHWRAALGGGALCRCASLTGLPTHSRRPDRYTPLWGNNQYRKNLEGASPSALFLLWLPRPPPVRASSANCEASPLVPARPAAQATTSSSPSASRTTPSAPTRTSRPSRSAWGSSSKKGSSRRGG